MLNKSQQEVYDAAIKWWNDRNEQTFEISGPPGSGKSFLINQIIDAIGVNRLAIAPMTYTGTAAINMRTKGMMNAKTIYSWCYNVISEPMLDENGNVIFDPIFNKPRMKLTFFPKSELPGIELIIVDEAGTVPPDMRRIIDSFHIPVLAAGDLDQLPPIFGKSGYLNDRTKVHFLTEIMRQAAGNTIIQFSQMAINKMDIPHGVHGNVMVIYEDELTDKMIADSGIVICSRNKTRNLFNEHIRHDMLGFRSDLPMNRERLVCRKNNWEVEAGGINLTNGLLGSVLNFPDPSSINMKSKTFRLDFKPDLCDEAFINLDVDYRFLKSTDQKEKDIMKMNNKHFPGDKFEYGYCITTHMSQGSEFPKGIYIEEFLKGDINHKLNYVGITRFRNSCIYVKKRPKRYWGKY